METHAGPFARHCLCVHWRAEIFMLPLQSINLFTTWRRGGETGGGREERKLVWGWSRDVSVFTLLWFFVGPVRRSWFRARLLCWFLGRPGAWSPGSFGCARWGRSRGDNLLIHRITLKSESWKFPFYSNLPLWWLLVARSRGVFMWRAGCCVFRVRAVRAFWSLRALWTRWWRPTSSAATPTWARWPAVTPLPVNARQRKWFKEGKLQQANLKKHLKIGDLTFLSWSACPPLSPSSSLSIVPQLSPSLSFPSLSHAQVSPFLSPTVTEAQWMTVLKKSVLTFLNCKKKILPF